MKALTREELLNLPAATDLATLGKAFGISEPVVRERHRLGDFEELGIRIVRFGAQWRVITADILRVLGITPTTATADPVSPGPAALADDPLRATEPSHGHRTPAA